VLSTQRWISDGDYAPPVNDSAMRRKRGDSLLGSINSAKKGQRMSLSPTPDIPRKPGTITLVETLSQSVSNYMLKPGSPSVYMLTESMNYTKSYGIIYL
jgi:hypothetical protein